MSEEAKKLKIYMGLPSTGNRSDMQCYSLRAIERDYADRVEFVYPENRTQRIFHDFARNGIVDEFLATDCDMLWFLDSDIAPPVTILDLIFKAKQPWEAAGATYPVFMSAKEGDTPKVVFTCYKLKDGKMACSEVPMGGVEFVDGLATGCLFLRRSVFANLKKPYFEFKYEPETRMMFEGEDLGFCKKLSELGIQFYTDYSMVCRHYKTVDLLEMNNYAVEYAQKSVNAYHREIRPMVTHLTKEVERLKSKTNLTVSSNKNQLVLPDYLKR